MRSLAELIAALTAAFALWQQIQTAQVARQGEQRCVVAWVEHEGAKMRERE